MKLNKHRIQLIYGCFDILLISDIHMYFYNRKLKQFIILNSFIEKTFHKLIIKPVWFIVFFFKA